MFQNSESADLWIMKNLSKNALYEEEFKWKRWSFDHEEFKWKCWFCDLAVPRATGVERHFIVNTSILAKPLKVNDEANLQVSLLVNLKWKYLNMFLTQLLILKFPVIWPNVHCYVLNMQ